MGLLAKSKNGFFKIPAIASAIIPGLGQIFKKQMGKGLVFLGLFLAWGYIMYIPGLLPFSGLLVFLISLAAWAINVLDAGFNSVGQRY